MNIETYTSGTNNQFVGPGTQPAEGPGFAAGGALAPGTPYNMFSGAPQVTGEGISQDFLLKPVYAITRSLDLSATIGYGSASGTGKRGELLRRRDHAVDQPEHRQPCVQPRAGLPEPQRPGSDHGDEARVSGGLDRRS